MLFLICKKKFYSLAPLCDPGHLEARALQEDPGVHAHPWTFLRSCWAGRLEKTWSCRAGTWFGSVPSEKKEGLISVWGRHQCTMVSILASGPSCPVFRNIINITEVNQQRWLKKSGEWLENVDRTRRVASQYNIKNKCFMPDRCNQRKLVHLVPL